MNLKYNILSNFAYAASKSKNFRTVLYTPSGRISGDIVYDYNNIKNQAQNAFSMMIECAVDETKNVSLNEVDFVLVMDATVVSSRSVEHHECLLVFLDQITSVTFETRQPD